VKRAEPSHDKGRSAPISRRAAIVGAGFSLTAGAAALVTPHRHEGTLGLARLEDLVPTAVGTWREAPGSRLILPDAEQLPSPYDQVLTRSFMAPSQPTIMFLVAYGAAQSGLMKVHRPEVCYRSSGFSIRDDRPIDVSLESRPAIAAKSFLAVRQDRAEHVLYWTRISDMFPRDLASQRLVMLKQGIAGLIPDGVLVRCSTLASDRDAELDALVNFVRALVASAPPRGRSLLIGRV
jgi:EpsI family protein